MAFVCPQVQERLTREIARAIEEAVHPSGVGVVMECRSVVNIIPIALNSTSDI
jgi:GTP cyclohydrolase I